jgi:hypothetical protein
MLFYPNPTNPAQQGQHVAVLHHPPPPLISYEQGPPPLSLSLIFSCIPINPIQSIVPEMTCMCSRKVSDWGRIGCGFRIGLDDTLESLVFIEATLELHGREDGSMGGINIALDTDICTNSDRMVGEVEDGSGTGSCKPASTQDKVESHGLTRNWIATTETIGRQGFFFLDIGMLRPRTVSWLI